MITATRIPMTTPTHMTTDARLLTLVQWLSPAFPTGGFAFSHGLESAIADGLVHDDATLEGWLSDCLLYGSGRTDAIWLRLAHASGDIATLNAHARAFAVSHERLREATRQGTAFTLTANAVWGLDMPDDLLLPLAVGHATARAALDADSATALYLHAFTSNLTSAAQRLMPLGQTKAQAVLHRLNASCLALTETTRGATQDDLHSTTFLSDIAAMRHETLQPRLFQS